jgi:hypothetical protein
MSHAFTEYASPSYSVKSRGPVSVIIDTRNRVEAVLETLRYLWRGLATFWPEKAGEAGQNGGGDADMTTRKPILDPNAPVQWPPRPIDAFPCQEIDRPPHLYVGAAWGDDRAHGWTLYSNARGDEELKYYFEVEFNPDDSARRILITLSDDKDAFEPLRRSWTGKETLGGLRPQWRKELRERIERAAVYLRKRNRVETAWLIEQFQTIPAARREPIKNKRGETIGVLGRHDAGWLISQRGKRTSAERLASAR